MPQFDQIGEIWASQLFWLAVFFGAMFFGVGRRMLPRIVSTVDARNKKIADDLSVAEVVRESAGKLEESYRVEMDKSRAKAMKALGAAKEKAGKATAASLAKAEKAISGKVDEATLEIGKARAAAMLEIESVATDAAVAMVERVAGLKLDSDAARKIVKQELANG